MPMFTYLVLYNQTINCNNLYSSNEKGVKGRGRIHPGCCPNGVQHLNCLCCYKIYCYKIYISDYF